MTLSALLAAAALAVVVPVHGVLIQSLPGGTAVIRTDPVTQTLPATIARVRLAPSSAIAPGTGIDGLLDRTTRPWTLSDPVAAGPFAPGVPDKGAALPVELGATLPHAQLVDQAGHVQWLDRAFLGRTALISFVFTRCPDATLCPAISGKYAYLQAHLDPKKFVLAEITLDPPYDSPAVLEQYGARYGAVRGQWYLLTGTGSTIKRALDAFGIDSLRVSTSNFIHSDKLYVVTSGGRIAYIVDTAGWDPDGVLAEARSVAGLSSNPWERFRLSLVASVVAICGGSQFAGIVLLELALFFVIVVLVGAGLWCVARVLWVKSPP